MIASDKEVAEFASWPIQVRIKALKSIVPHAKVKEILQRSGRSVARCPRLPAWFMVWFVIALGLFCRDSYRQVFRWLQPYRRKGTPPRSSLCEARHRLGVAPMRWLCETVVELLGKETTPGAFYQGLRLMAIDGFVVDIADTEKNERAFGRPGSGRSPGAFPQVRVLSLCEVGSHVLWRNVIKPYHRGEIPMARYLMRFLTEGMLLLWDRNFLSYDMVEKVLSRKAHLLGRIKKNLIFEAIEQLPDGSYLAKLYRNAKDRRHDRDGIVVRIIDYTFNDPQRPGSGEKHRLLTTLLDAEQHPAETLIELYHERWEQELAIDELKTHQRERPVLRSQTPAAVVQEIYGLLIGHYVIRTLMQEAATKLDIDPQRLSFTNTLKILRCRLPECPKSERGRHRWHRQLIQEISEEVLEPRRNRINPRVIKKKMSNWEKKKPKHLRYPQPEKEFRDAILVIH
jgi:Insertion element 4 transposase N-terminal/Transposase DDE domain